MAKDPQKRLGQKGAAEIKGHPWFHPLDWKQVLRRQAPVPFRPIVADELDVRNFADEFTEQDPIDSPAKPPKKHVDLFRVRQAKQYLAGEMTIHSTGLLLHWTSSSVY